MLQKTASNAYSWWWASHIRTKQSKWLEQNLQDMEGKVESVLKLIEEDGDSFAKRAEMYYEKRPVLISFVEESYRAYRDLAERYDRISTELQNANTTIAAVFPEKVQFAEDDEDDLASTKIPKKNATKVPKFRSRDSTGIVRLASEKLQGKKSSKSANSNATVWKSGLSKFEAVEEIDKAEKEILALQTVKDFVKSSYEIGITKYREIEDRITELQDRVLSLQDEFRVGKLIEDGEARALMVEAALKSCQEALAQLQEKQERPTEETRAEYQRVEDARQKLKSLRHKFGKLNEEDEPAKAGEKLEHLNSEGGVGIQESLELNGLREKIAEHFDVGSKELLVTKVSSLENTVSSQTALIDRLRSETTDLQTQIRTLEDYKAALIDDSNTLTNRLREMAEKCEGLKDLNQKLESQNNDLQAHFTESSIDHLSEKPHSMNPDKELKEEEEEFSVGIRTPEEMEKREDFSSSGDDSIKSRGLESAIVEQEIEQVLSLSINEHEEEEEKVSELRSNSDSDSISEKREDPNSLDKVDKQGVRQTTVNEPKKAAIEKDGLDWQEMLLDGLEDKEKFLLTDYVTILKKYKELRKKHSDVETEHQDRVFETMVQLRELRSTIAMKDKEIQFLRRKLDLVQINLNDQNAKHDATNQEVLKVVNEALGIPPTKKEVEEEEEKLILIDQSRSVSSVEENLRIKINALLDKNLDLWLRFSTSFHQIQKFKTGFRDSQAEISKLERKGKSNREGIATADIKSDLRSVHKNLREMQIDLKLWIEHSVALKDEFQSRYSSLCSIQEEITKALMAGSKEEEEEEGEEEMKFTSHEAAKFEGEILNMKHENKKVRDELQASLDHATTLRQEIDKTLAKLSDEFGISQTKNDNQSQISRSASRVRVPLRSLIFGTKPKKKSSFFSFMYRRKYHGHRAGPPM